MSFETTSPTTERWFNLLVESPRSSTRKSASSRQLFEIRGFEGCIEAEGKAKEIVTRKGYLSSKFCNFINKIRYNKFTYLRIKTEDKEIAINIKALANSLKFVDEQIVLPENKLNLSKPSDIRKAHKDNNLEKKLKQLSEIQATYNQIHSHYQELEKAESEFKTMLEGRGGLLISERRLRKVVEKAFQNIKEGEAACFELPSKKNRQTPTKFQVSKEGDHLQITSVPQKLAEGNCGVVFDYYDMNAAQGWVIKKAKKADEIKIKGIKGKELQTLAKTFLAEIKQEHTILETVSGQWGFPELKPTGSDFDAIVVKKYGELLPNPSGNQSFRDKLINCHRAIYAMAWLQKHGIIHGDIKKKNFVIDELGMIYLIDYGTATTDGTLPDNGALSYRHAEDVIAYMNLEANEQANHDQLEKIRWGRDPYAVGVFLYELLTGELPSGKIDPRGVLEKDYLSEKGGKELIDLIMGLSDKEYQTRLNGKEALKRLQTLIEQEYKECKEIIEERSSRTFDLLLDDEPISLIYIF